MVDDNSENQEELNAVVGGFSQVELILTQGGGAGHARNEGLKYIRGKGSWLRMLMIFITRMLFLF